jgi:hypothetical protein
MPDLAFQVERADVVPFAASPTVAFRLRVANQPEAERIHTVALRCQIQLEVTRRKYTPDEQKHLRELFGEPERWSQTLKTMLWTHTSCVVPSFQGSTEVDLHVPCSFDFNVGATKYFYGLEDGEIPLCLQFSGTVFHEGNDGNLLVAPIPWDKETRFRFPVRIWREMMETYYPNSTWLRLRRDVFDRLYEYKIQHGFLTWEQALESVLSTQEATARL